MTSPSLVLNQTEVAEFFGVSPKTVQTWDKMGLADAARLPSEGRSARYRLAKAVRWRMEMREAELRAELTEVTSAEADARRRKAEAQARLAELEVHEREGSMIRAEDLDEVLAALVTAMRQAVDQLPARWGPRIVGISGPAEGTERMVRLRDDLLRAFQHAAADLDATAAAIEEAE